MSKESNRFTIAVDTSGELWGWGWGDSGRRGDGLLTNNSSPVQLGSLVKWAQISAGYRTSIGLRTDGTMWTWGRNNEGQLGINSTVTPMLAPIQVGLLTTWAQISGTDDSMGAIKTDGTLWTWGNNGVFDTGSDGALGLGDTTNRSSPTQVGSLTNWSKIDVGTLGMSAIKTDGTLWAWGNGTTYGANGLGDTTDRSSPVQVGSLTNWTDVVRGNNTMYAINSDGKLYACGWNGQGQLGQGGGPNLSTLAQIGSATNWTSIHALANSLHAINSAGEFWACGHNNNGQLGQGNTSDTNVLVQVGSLTNWLKFTRGDSNSQSVVIIKTDGTMWGIGDNDQGQLGIGTTSDLSSPVQVGSRTDWAGGSSASRVCHFLNNDGIMYASGDGNTTYGYLGDGTVNAYSSPVQVGNHSPYISIAGGNAHTLAVTKDGKMWGWGNASPEGEVGDLTTVDKSFPVQIGAGITWAKVAAHDFSAAITNDGKLYTWGAGFNGGTGHGNTTDVSSPVQVGSLTDWGTLNVRSARFGSVKTDGTLWMCGNGGNGALANGSSTSVSSPIQVGSLTTWVRIGMGLQHCAGLTTAGTIFTWGANGSGQLGHGGTTAVSSPVQVGSLTDWADLSVGSSFTVAIKTDGTLWAWGDSGNGKLGNGDASTDYSSPIQIGSLTDWKTLCLLGSEGVRAIKTDGTLWAWGRGTVGQIGNGSANSISSPVQVGSRTDWLVGNVSNLGSLGIRDND